ncbi:MAG: LamG-like jellyroll fold domain-containing protein [Planctomycetota bacterium]|jgi:7,8-dihydropterin-6-yl-methyl-4-(beta-D-ribofuranosyl)aminobenzene 5'-phosphate synthase
MEYCNGVKKRLVLTGFVISVMLTGIARTNAGSGVIEITVLYDNYTVTEGCTADWGFSCMITGTEKNILFDAGAYGSILLGNMDMLGISAQDADLIVISHNHGDHTGNWQSNGGLLSFLSRNNNVSVYLPPSVTSGHVQLIEAAGASGQIVNDSMQLCERVYLTGPMSGVAVEQALVIDTPKGLAVITGCAHPGIVQIIQKAKQMLDKDVYFVFGGFHLSDDSDSQIISKIQQFKSLGVRKCGASHCTGDRAIELFKQEYGADFVSVGVGPVTIPVVCDLNTDGIVDAADMCIIVDHWKTNEPSCDLAPGLFGDGIVDVRDLIVLAEHLFEGAGLVAHWALDETEGDIAYDSASNIDAAVHEGQWTVGKVDGALMFNGLTTYMDCGDSLRLRTQKMTLAMWLEPEHMGGMRYVLSRASEVADDFDYVLMRHYEGHVEFALAQEGSDPVSVMSNATTPLNEWTHVAVCLDGSHAAIYINGQFDASVDYGRRIPCEGCRLWISSLGGDTRFYNGKIDDLRVYNIALTAGQIEEMAR